MERKKINETMANWSSYEVDGKLEDIISKLSNIIKERPDHFDFYLNVETESGYYNETSTNLKITANRWETNKEFEVRKAASLRASEAAKLSAQRRVEQKEIDDRLLYESLKKKFDKETTNPLPPS